jgi:hypothetical protein
MSRVLANEADLYFLAPIRIHDYQLFESNLSSAGWVRPSDVPFDLYAPDALYESEAAFLGILKAKDGAASPLLKDGICFVAPDNPKDGTVLSHFRKTFRKGKNSGRELSFQIRKKQKFEAEPIWISGLTVGGITRIHISPDKDIAVFLIHFRMPQTDNVSIEQVESTSYWLHKTDGQAPTILVEESSIPGFETVLDMITTLINSPSEVASLYHPGRLLTATYVQVQVPASADGPDSEFLESVNEHVVRIGLSKDKAYDISEEDKKQTYHLFNNILVHASPEGFCGAFLAAEDQENTVFMEKSSTTFLKSYLPIFLETVLVELISVHMLDKNNTVKLKERSEQFRELKLMEVMPVSRYSHLLQLKRIISQALSISPKIETVSSYLDTLRERKEQRQESFINFLIGFMGVGQVVFAILDLSRTSYVTDSTPWQITASALSVVFGILAVLIIVVVARSYFKKD